MTPRPPRRATGLTAGRGAALALAAALALGACADGPAPGCRTDADCPAAARCEAAAGVCVGFATPLWPAPDAGYADRADAP